MKEFNDYKEEIYKCSKCGLCQSVCPVYKATKNECAVSRGKFILLNGVALNEIKLNKSVINNLDLCLNCNACKDFCPSDIDAKEIFACAKYEYSKQNHRGNSALCANLFELKLALLNIFIRIYRALNIDKLVDSICVNKHTKSPLLKPLRLFNSVVPISTNQNNDSIESHKGKVLFFEGCYNKHINPSSKNATINLIKKLGYEVSVKKNKCCGIHSYYSGHFHSFKNNAEQNLKTFPADIDYIICDCDSCISALKTYDDLIENENKIASKVISITDFLIKNKFYKNYKKKLKITYHKPCHSETSPVELLKNLENIEYFQLPNGDSCCGNSQNFALKHKNISKVIAEDKAIDIIKTGADIVVTSCHSCVIGLRKGLIEKSSNISVMNLSEFLNLEED